MKFELAGLWHHSARQYRRRNRCGIDKHWVAADPNDIDVQLGRHGVRVTILRRPLVDLVDKRDPGGLYTSVGRPSTFLLNQTRVFGQSNC